MRIPILPDVCYDVGSNMCLIIARLTHVSPNASGVRGATFLLVRNALTLRLIDSRARLTPSSRLPFFQLQIRREA